MKVVSQPRMNTNNVGKYYAVHRDVGRSIDRKGNLPLILQPCDAAAGLTQSTQSGWLLRMDWLTTQRGAAASNRLRTTRI